MPVRANRASVLAVCLVLQALRAVASRRHGVEARRGTRRGSAPGAATATAVLCQAAIGRLLRYRRERLLSVQRVATSSPPVALARERRQRPVPERHPPRGRAAGASNHQPARPASLRLVAPCCSRFLHRPEKTAHDSPIAWFEPVPASRWIVHHIDSRVSIFFVVHQPEAMPKLVRNCAEGVEGENAAPPLCPMVAINASIGGGRSEVSILHRDRCAPGPAGAPCTTVGPSHARPWPPRPPLRAHEHAHDNLALRRGGARCR